MPSAIVKQRPRSTFPKGFFGYQNHVLFDSQGRTFDIRTSSEVYVVTFCLLGGWLGFVEVFGASTNPPWNSAKVLFFASESWWGEQPTAFFSFSANAWLANYMGKWHSPQNDAGKSESASNYMKRLADLSKRIEPVEWILWWYACKWDGWWRVGTPLVLACCLSRNFGVKAG